MPNLHRQIEELLSNGIISEETAEKIVAYFANKEKDKPANSWLIIAFGILGALLAGLGLLLIVAHNWEKLPQTVQTFFAFLPMLVGQALGAWVLFKKQGNVAWTEGVATFLFLSIGACLALVSQIYQLQGELSQFLLTWMLLAGPIAYVLRASTASLLFVAGITYFAFTAGYDERAVPFAFLYFGLLAAILPYYYSLIRNRPQSNFLWFHHGVIPLSMIISLGILGVASPASNQLFVGYMSLFGLFYVVSHLPAIENSRGGGRLYRFLGSMGTVILMLITSFKWFAEMLQKDDSTFQQIMGSAGFIASVGIILAALGLIFWLYKRLGLGVLQDLVPFGWVFLVFAPLFWTGLIHSIFVFAAVNGLVFIMGVTTILAGARRENLRKLNFGLLILTAWIGCRFFDLNLTFIQRGILFLVLGAGFFAGNYWLIKRKSR